MMRVPAALFALVLCAVPLGLAPVRAVAVGAGLGLLLTATGLVGFWRWPVVVGACVFLIDYTAALWIARAPVSVGGAVAFGLALLLLLQSVELGRGLRHGRVEGRLIRAQLAAWAGFATATLGVTLLGLALAGGLAASIPFAAAPFVAGLAALGVVVALAAIIRRGFGSTSPWSRVDRRAMAESSTSSLPPPAL